MEVVVELLFTFVRVLVVDILLGTVFYWIGYLVCKLVTLGRYPNVLGPASGEKKSTLVGVVGFVVSLGIFLFFIYWS
jgi:hypothetical protein